MLTFHDSSPLFGRREFLRIGGLSLGGLALTDLLGPSLSAAPAEKPLSDCSVIFLFLHGGPSQFETFDPRMNAPVGVRSVTGEIPTKLPGITFASSFPKLAALADRLTIVRSFVPGDANHDIKPIVCKQTSGGNLGSAYAHVAGANHPRTGMPTNALLTPKAIDPTARPVTMSFGNFASSGPFGTVAAPFMPGAGGSLQSDMQLKLPRERLDDRRTLLKSFDRLKAAHQARMEVEGEEDLREKAIELILGGVGDAFDLSRENPKVVARYDTAPLVRPENIDKKWRNYNNYVDNARCLGKLLLLARRLCERGCGFVTITTSFVWDMHADVNNAPVEEGMRYMGPPLDHALSAFIEDTEARGSSKKILLVCCGEMGRTPRINKNGGRDHWGNLGPLLLVGGGLPMGQVIGQSNANGSEPASEPVLISHLLSTIMHSLFDVGKLRVTPGVGREVLQMAEADPIPGLHG